MVREEFVKKNLVPEDGSFPSHMALNTGMMIAENRGLDNGS